MPKAKTAREIGQACYKVRIAGSGMLIHTISRTEPKVQLAPNGSVAGILWDPILGTEYGDTIGFIQWDLVTAITWRHTSDIEGDQERSYRPMSTRRERL